MEFNIDTEKDLKFVAEEIHKTLQIKMALESRTSKKYTATVIGLFGDLGSGKTTFTKYFGKSFGILMRDIISPTFVIQKRFDIKQVSKSDNDKVFKNLYHLDVYRIDDSSEILSLGWDKMINDPKNIILVEWAEKIQDILPDDTIKIYLKSTGENSRNIKIDIN